MDFLQQIQWRPQIGDPTPMGWLTVAAYAAAAVVAFAAGFRGDRRLWQAVGTLMLLLCVNKQLDLQSLITDIGRAISWRQGWYGERRIFQKWLVLGILALSCISGGFVAWRFREFWKSRRMLAAGLFFLLTFIVVRAVSFHHVDVLLKTSIAGVRANWLLELTGIGLIACAAARQRLGKKR